MELTSENHNGAIFKCGHAINWTSTAEIFVIVFIYEKKDPT